MKRFLTTVFGAAIFFVGLGALVDKAGAHFKSDEKALELVRKARVAIGGDSAINSIQSLKITGKTTKTVKVNGLERADQGDTEIAFQLPDKFTKSLSFSRGDGSGKVVASESNTFNVTMSDGEPGLKEVRVFAGGKGDGAEPGAAGPAKVQHIFIRKPDGTTEEVTGDAANVIAMRHPDVTGSPDGRSVERVIIRHPDGTEGQVNDGAAHTMILRKDGDQNAVFATKADGAPVEHVMLRRAGGEGNGSGYRSNDLLKTTLGLLMAAPAGMDVTYKFGGESTVDGTACNVVVAEFASTAYKIYLSQSTDLPVMLSYQGFKEPMIMQLRTKVPDGAAAPVEKEMTFDRVVGPSPNVEMSVKFSDYRTVNGVQLPFKWTQVSGGNPDETFDVTTYDVNPADIGDKFQNQKVMLRTKAPTK